jgi:DNA-binding MarR family transcriptional regulator
MKNKDEITYKVLMAARDTNINSVLFRNAMGRKLGLNITESECVTFLGIKGVSTPTEIAKYTGLTSGSTTTMLDRLEKKNIIKRKSNPDDRRGVIIELNEEYGKVAQPLVAGIQKAHRELIDRFSVKELETVINFLTGFTNNIIEHTKKIEKGN